MDKLNILTLIAAYLLISVLSHTTTAMGSIYDTESGRHIAVSTLGYIDNPSDGIIIGSPQDLVGYYNNDNWLENNSDAKHNGISDPLVHFANEVQLFGDSTFVSVDFGLKNCRYYRTGRWTVRNQTVELYSYIPLVKNLDFVDSPYYIMLMHKVFIEDTLVYDIVSPDIKIPHNYDKTVLSRNQYRTIYLPKELRYDENHCRIALLQKTIANDDTTAFIKLYNSDAIKDNITSDFNEMLVRYAITQRSPNILMFMNNTGFIKPKNIDRHPYKYALRLILYPSKYDLKPKRSSNIEQRNALILDISRNWHQSIILDETDKEVRIELDRKSGKLSGSPLFPSIYQLLLW